MMQSLRLDTPIHNVCFVCVKTAAAIYSAEMTLRGEEWVTCLLLENDVIIGYLLSGHNLIFMCLLLSF